MEKETIITENVVYEKINCKGRIIIPKYKQNKTENENEVIVDELGRIQLAKSILTKIGVASGDKLEIYISGRNVILKKLKVQKQIIRETKLLIDNKYEVKIGINNIDLNANHKVSIIDELGRILIWSELRDKLGIIERDKLKVCTKNNMIILIPKKKK